MILVRWQNVTDTVAYWTEVYLYGDAIGENPYEKFAGFAQRILCSNNAEMEQVFAQIAVFYKQDVLRTKVPFSMRQVIALHVQFDCQFSLTDVTLRTDLQNAPFYNFRLN